MPGIPLNKGFVKARLEAIRKHGARPDGKKLRAFIKKLGLKTPTSLDEMTPEQRKSAAQTLRSLKRDANSPPAS